MFKMEGIIVQEGTQSSSHLFVVVECVGSIAWLYCGIRKMPITKLPLFGTLGNLVLSPPVMPSALGGDGVFSTSLGSPLPGTIGARRRICGYSRRRRYLASAGEKSETKSKMGGCSWMRELVKWTYFGGRPGTRQCSVNLFVSAAPPRRCPLLFCSDCHRRAAAMGG